MNKKIIIIEGYLASGKSTFARKLSKAIKVPYLIKDTFKIALCQNINVSSREESSRFSVVTFDGMMYVVERMLETGYPMIIEGNFVPSGVKNIDESRVIKDLIDKYDYKALNFKFMGDTEILHHRFIERENTPERGQVNTMGFIPSHDDFSNWCRNLDGFDIGGTVIKVDTTDFGAVDFNSYINSADLFMNDEFRDLDLAIR